MSPSSSLHCDEFRSEMTETESPMLKFPVSPGCFHPTGRTRQAYLDRIRHYVRAILAEEEHIAARRDQCLPALDPTKWKQVHMSNELRFFKRIRGGQTLHELAEEETVDEVRQAVESGYSTLLCHGHVRGSIEDMMYGMTASSQADLMTGFWYHTPPRDCVWLGTAERATPEDPFRSADFIWAFPKLTYRVDVCYLKATGVETDDKSTVYGYLVLHSVELPHCRPFEARKVSRAKMYFACLFRERRPGHVHVFVRGIINLGKRRGPIAKKVVTSATKSFMIGLLNGVGIGLAKKLTLLAREHHHVLEARKPMGCAICFRTKKRILFGLHLVPCGVCGATVCSNCLATTKQMLFIGYDAPCSKHACCLPCMRDAKRLWGVRPQELKYQVIADYFFRGTHRSGSAALRCTTSPVSLPTYPPLDTKSRSSGRGFGIKSTLSADLPTGSTAHESVDTDPFSRDLDEADFCFSDDDASASSILAQPDPSPNRVDESDKSTLTIWQRQHETDEQDFIPATNVQIRTDVERFHHALYQLNLTAEKTYIQTQVTARRLREAELD
ncbi:hypothetical protein PsorP6_006670 [Peronosclerospora sorghi]|uniref:Uncharacterized protein n=1 Tax=Peronosclerospora sorghi TaxID=230839 RepID=A0ACC0W548_9STRA|nr:hypothetical protein PsorP6_006670 [Peronosclerospora sorghi]